MEINRNNHYLARTRKETSSCACLGWVKQTAIVKEFIVKWQCHVDKCVGWIKFSLINNKAPQSIPAYNYINTPSCCNKQLILWPGHIPTVEQPSYAHTRNIMFFILHNLRPAHTPNPDARTTKRAFPVEIHKFKATFSLVCCSFSEREKGFRTETWTHSFSVRLI